MKTILLLTDFSENATHAALSGLMLAKQMHANMLLFNANLSQAVAPVYAGGPTVIDTLNIEEDVNDEKLRNLAKALEAMASNPGNWEPHIHYEERLGNLAYNVKLLTEEKNIEMIVMGAREGDRLDHFLSGSETFSVIDNVPRPVLLVPNKSGLNKLQRVVFATNFNEQDINAIKYLIRLSDVFNFGLEIVHVNQLGQADITKHLREIEFEKHAHRLRYSPLVVKEVYGKEIIGRIDKACRDVNADLLAFSHYHDSLISGLFKRSITKRALSKQNMPLLIFPSKFAD